MSSYLLDNICISYTLLYTAYIVKILEFYHNPPVTKALILWNTLVGTSEAIRLLNKKLIHIISFSLLSLNPHTYGNNNTSIQLDRRNSSNKNTSGNSNEDIVFKQWLAGLIDGDGCFLLSKKGYASLEITMDIRDERVLQTVKNVYGGSIRLRAGVNALRYRLHHKQSLICLIVDVNGQIRNPRRLLQLNSILAIYNVDAKFSEKLTFDNAWLSGFFDADGTIAINSSNWQLSISASQKTPEILMPLTELYEGHIYMDRAGNGSYKWYVTKKEHILKLLEYFKLQPCRSAKNNRLHLIPKIYELKEKRAHVADKESSLAKSWSNIIEKWNKYE